MAPVSCLLSPVSCLLSSSLINAIANYPLERRVPRKPDAGI